MEKINLSEAAIRAGSQLFKNSTKLTKFMSGYSFLKKNFQKTTGKKFHKFTINVLEKIFDLMPNSKVNDLNKTNYKDTTTVHHKDPQRSIKGNQAKMADSSNLEPMSRERHNKADNGIGRNENIDHAAKRTSFSYAALSFFDMLITSFIFGFFTELLVGVFKKLIIKDKDTKFKSIFVSSLKVGLTMLLVSIPFGLITFILALTIGENAIATTIVQLVIAIGVIGFNTYLIIANSINNGDETNTKKKKIAIFIVRTFVFLAISIVCEVVFEGIIPEQPFLSDLVATLAMIPFAVVERLIFDCFENKNASNQMVAN